MPFTTQGQVHVLSDRDARRILDRLEEVSTLISVILDDRRLTLELSDVYKSPPLSAPAPAPLDDIF